MRLGTHHSLSELPRAGYVSQDVQVVDFSGRPRDINIILNEQHGTWLRDLAADFELRWMTMWNDEANHIITPLLGLPQLPVVRPGIRSWGNADKLPTVRDAARGRAAAWIDDECFWCAPMAMSTWPSPTWPSSSASRQSSRGAQQPRQRAASGRFACAAAP